MLPSEEQGLQRLEGVDEGTVPSCRWRRVEDWRVCRVVERNHFDKTTLTPKELATVCIIFHPCAIWPRIVVSHLLRPMLGQQEAHPQPR